MKKNLAWLIIILLIIVLIGYKLIFNKSSEGNNSSSKSGKGNSLVAANYFVVSTTELNNNIYSSGKIGALNEVELKSEISGRVVSIFFTEGKEVKKGEPLVKLNDADIQAQLTKNKIQLKLAEEKLARLTKLLAVNGISQEEYDVQENEVAVLKADQLLIQSNLNKATIIAPFSGRIGLKNISEGSYVTPTQSIASLVQLKPVYVEFSLPEKYSSEINIGTGVKFSADGISEEQYAEVYAIEPKIEEITKTLRCRAIYKGDKSFYPGSFVKVFVEMKNDNNALMIPTECIIPILKGQKVYVCQNGIAHERKIISGIRTDQKIQILEGLKVGDTVLTTGLLSVKEGSNLKLIHR
ncbi:MAG: efflux RND transporter periplasmic adaptor subunit [Bacteroidia bacterium]